MVEIVPPHIESISDPGAGSRDQPGPKPRARAVGAAKPHPPHLPDISPAEEEDKHELDELA
jgi:hypothetical protein